MEQNVIGWRHEQPKKIVDLLWNNQRQIALKMIKLLERLTALETKYNKI